MPRTPIHAGEILAEEIGLSAKRLADVIEVPPNRLYQLLSGKRNVTADTALRLSQYFGMSADFWMNLQSAYELDLARKQTGRPFSEYRNAKKAYRRSRQLKLAAAHSCVHLPPLLVHWKFVIPSGSYR